jgi:hypothetical protein
MIIRYALVPQVCPSEPVAETAVRYVVTVNGLLPRGDHTMTTLNALQTAGLWRAALDFNTMMFAKQASQYA